MQRRYDSRCMMRLSQVICRLECHAMALVALLEGNKEVKLEFQVSIATWFSKQRRTRDSRFTPAFLSSEDM